MNRLNTVDTRVDESKLRDSGGVERHVNVGQERKDQGRSRIYTLYYDWTETYKTSNLKSIQPSPFTFFLKSSTRRK